MVRAVEGRPLDADPVQRRLDDGVLLGVEPPAELMAFAGGDVVLLPEAADLQAVAEPRRGAVVTRGEDPPVADQGGADAAPQAGGAFATSPTISRK